MKYRIPLLLLLAACAEPDALDADQDGYAAWDDGGTDCDDGDADIHPEAAEVCDGEDNDCDGQIDEGDATDATPWYADDDQDGYGHGELSVTACDQPSGFVADNTDCDDDRVGVNPGATEDCDGLDDDCDGSIDEGLDVTLYLDRDGDGWGDDAEVVEGCEAGAWTYVTDAGDCDDADPDIHPEAESRCDDVDRDCDGQVDDDADEDGYSDAECGGSDCDDDYDWIHPDRLEMINGIDDDCDGWVDAIPSSDAVVTHTGGWPGDQVGDQLQRADLDGDGFEELWVPAEGGLARLGLTADSSLSDATVLRLEDLRSWGSGDVGGDGYADLILGGESSLYLLDGPLTAGGSVESLALGEVYGVQGSTSFATGVTTSDAGWAFGAGGAVGGNGWVGVVSAPFTGVVDVMDVATSMWTGTMGGSLGASMSRTDLDGDGTPELLVGMPGASEGSGMVVWLPDPLNTAGGPVTGSATLSWTVEGADDLGASMAAGADIDGDGYEDALIGAPVGDGLAVVLHGGTEPSTGAVLTGTADSATGTSVDLADIDADGYADLLVTAPDAELSARRAGAAWVLYGPVTGSLALETDADLSVQGAEAFQYLGNAGVLDAEHGWIWLTAPGAESQAGAVMAFEGVSE